MGRKRSFFEKSIYSAVLIGWMLWCLNMQVRLMRIDFGDVTAENTAVVVEYDCISMKGSSFYFPIYEMELDGLYLTSVPLKLLVLSNEKDLCR